MSASSRAGEETAAAGVSAAALEVAVRKVASAADRRGWDQPPMLLSLVAADALALISPEQVPGPGSSTEITLGVIPEAEVTSHPLDFLSGTFAPDYVLGLILVTEAWSFPRDFTGTLAASSRPDQHPRRRELRVITAVTRDGKTAVFHRERDGDTSYQATTRPVPGTIVAALQRTLGMATMDTGFTVEHLVGMAVLNRVVGFVLDEVRDGHTVTYDAAAAEFRSTFATLPVAEEPERLFGDPSLPTWETFRQAAADGALDGMPEGAAAWMDENMFAATLADSFDPAEDLFDTLRAALGDRDTIRFREELRRRYWLR